MIKRNSRGQFIKGQIPWNKGKEWLEMKGNTFGFKKGQKAWNKGIKRWWSIPTEFKKKDIPWNKGTKGIMKSNKASFKKGQIPWNKGLNKENDKRIQKIAKEKMGKNHPNWLGGISFEPYGLEFNEELKEQIRKRDNYQCQECNSTQKELGYKLPVHHIDYNKQNNNPKNLISLCRRCHTQTNFKRADWTKYFMRVLLENRVCKVQ